MKRRQRLVFWRSTPNGGSWRWTYYASNGRVLADSGEGYKRRIDCFRAASAVIGTTVTADYAGHTLPFVRRPPLLIEVNP